MCAHRLPHAHAARPQPRRRLALAMALSLFWLGGCVLRPPQSSEETMVDSQMPGELVGTGLVGKPFCLHLRYRNHFFPAYSDSRAETWVTEGSCASKGPGRPVGTLRLSWWYDWQDTQTSHQCLQAERCSMDEQNIVLSRNVRCAAAQATDGPYTAFITTDANVCH